MMNENFFVTKGGFQSVDNVSTTVKQEQAAVCTVVKRLISVYLKSSPLLLCSPFSQAALRPRKKARQTGLSSGTPKESFFAKKRNNHLARLYCLRPSCR